MTDDLEVVRDREIEERLAEIAASLPDGELLEKWKAINSLLDYRLLNGEDLVATMLADLVLEHIAATVRNLIPRDELDRIMDGIDFQ